jgi:hypothetical protein
MTALRQRMIEDMQVRSLSPHTQRAYLQYISQFACHFRKSPDLLGPAEIRAFQLYLTRDKQLAASSVGMAVAAIRFLYKVTLQRGWNVDDVIPTCRRPQTLPVVMSPDEVARFLDAVESLKHRVILTVCYAAGLRISEAVRLTPAAIDSQRMTIRVEQGKGRKDRYVMLSPRLAQVQDTCLCRGRHKHVHAAIQVMPSRSAPSQQDAPFCCDQRGIIKERPGTPGVCRRRGSDRAYLASAPASRAPALWSPGRLRRRRISYSISSRCLDGRSHCRSRSVCKLPGQAVAGLATFRRKSPRSVQAEDWLGIRKNCTGEQV